MKFRTIVITKKVIAVFLILAVFIPAACFIIKISCGKTEPTFNISEEDILYEGMPEEAQDFNAAGFIKKLLGLEPDKIMAQYLSSPSDLNDTSSENPTPEQNAENPNGENNPAPEESPSPAPIQSSAPASMPSKEQISSGAGLTMSNATSYSEDLNSLCAQELTFSIQQNTEPQVLVVHTHSTECYDGDAMQGDSERNTDESKNVMAVGQVICDTLKEYGIESIHDKTVHDYPTYQGAYTRTLKTIESNLNAYPSIKVVLDVHRDAFVYKDGRKLRVASDINGVPTAQVMLVVGTDSMGLYHPKWRENLKLAAKIQSAANIMYPGLMRSIDLRTERFNMHMTTGSLLLEVGSNGNTLAEALEGGKDAASALAAVLLAG